MQRASLSLKSGNRCLPVFLKQEDNSHPSTAVGFLIGPAAVKLRELRPVSGCQAGEAGCNALLGCQRAPSIYSRFTPSWVRAGALRVFLSFLFGTCELNRMVSQDKGAFRRGGGARDLFAYGGEGQAVSPRHGERAQGWP